MGRTARCLRRQMPIYLPPGSGSTRGNTLRKLVIAVALACALLAPGVAGAATGRSGSATPPPINWGVADDASKFADDGGAWFYGQLQGANLTENRWTLFWDPSNPTAITELPFFQRAAPVAQAAGVHVVLALYARPATATDPVGFCSWAAQVATTAMQWGIHDFIVWNEPNTALYWAPQDSGAPAKYEALLAACYASIHAADPAAVVIGMGLSPRSNGASQTAPIPFIAGVAAAYKASGRQLPIMDQLSVHPYPNPNSPTDSPDVGYGVTNNYGVFFQEEDGIRNHCVTGVQTCALPIYHHDPFVDLLQSRPEVDPARIGAIGHSLGGHNAMFVGLFDERIMVIVSSCGWTPLHDYYEIGRASCRERV